MVLKHNVHQVIILLPPAPTLSAHTLRLADLVLRDVVNAVGRWTSVNLPRQALGLRLLREKALMDGCWLLEHGVVLEVRYGDATSGRAGLRLQAGQWNS